VLCRRWNWRQDARTLVTPQTRRIVLTAQSNGSGDVEAAAAEYALHRFGIIAVGLQVFHPLAEIVLASAMQNRDIVAFLHQLGDKVPPDEHSSANYQNLHLNTNPWRGARCP